MISFTFPYRNNGFAIVETTRGQVNVLIVTRRYLPYVELGARVLTAMNWQPGRDA